MKIAFGFIALALLAAPCLSQELYVDLRTNYSPATDFGSVRVEVLDRSEPRNQWVALAGNASGADFVRGERVAAFTDLLPGRDYLIVVQLLDRQLRPVDGRMTLLSMPAGRFVATVRVAH